MARHKKAITIRRSVLTKTRNAIKRKKLVKRSRLEATAFTLQEKRMMRHLFKSQGGGLYFSRFVFKNRDSRDFIVNSHHKVVSKALQDVLDGKIKRLIINIPPGYTKTEEAVINFMARGLAINPSSLFMHLSYADDLALWNSTLTKDIVESSEFQELFPMKVRADVSSKKKWYTEKGGGVYATAAGGPVTGFRAGRLEANKFSGALIIDDPIKPQDALSESKRNMINERFNSTFKSRLAKEDTTPIIVIMQRVHEDDPSGYLLKGGTGEKWHHLILPMDVPEEPVKEWYPKEYSHGIPIEYDLPAGPLWPFKHSKAEINKLSKASPYTHASQNQQQPSPKGGKIFKDEWWRYYATKATPKSIILKRMYCDTAQKTKEHNDYSVFQIWGFDPKRGIFLLDQKRGKWEAPQLKIEFINFWNKHKFHHINNPIGVQKALIEDKASGTGLIQDIKKDALIPVQAVQRNIDKVTRAMDVVDHIASGHVHIPNDQAWVDDYVSEFGKFSPLMAHKHDDQIDPTMDAIDDLLINGNLSYANML